MQFETFETITADEAHSLVQDAFNKALAANDNKVYVIRADTGIGKSEIIKNANASFLLAVPTHALKEQTVKDFGDKGKYVRFTPALPDNLDEFTQDAIDRLYMVGAVSKASALLRVKATEDATIAKYIQELDEALQTRKTLVTTHARLFYMNTHHNTIVIDEDILPTMLQQSVAHVGDIINLNQLFDEKGFGRKNHPDKPIIRGLVSLVYNSIENAPTVMPDVTLSDYKAFEKKVLAKELKSNVLGFLTSVAFVRKGDLVYFIQKKRLPEDKKIIILSATANEKLYSALFGERLVYIDTPNVALTGELTQYNINTSRNGLSKEGMLERIKEIIKDSNVITFKSFAKDFDKVVGTFGGLTGLNHLSGQDVAVIGTPHINDVAYILMAKALGQRLSPLDMEIGLISNRKIRRNGFEFYFTTYSTNTILQEIHLHLVESEIMQAIGRARLTRTGAHVKLVSNYPVKHAQHIAA